MSAVAALVIAAVGIQCRLLYTVAEAADRSPMPGRVAREFIRDHEAQIWLLAFDHTRSLMPDWETYVLYGGDPMLERVRDVDAEELRQVPVARPRALDRRQVPGAAGGAVRARAPARDWRDDRPRRPCQRGP